MRTKPKTRHRTGSAETINPDHIRMHRFIVFGVVVTLLAAVLTSWNGLNYIGRAQLLGDMSWLTPVMIDVPLIVLTLARGALRKRGIRTPGLLWGIFGLTVYSSQANFFHSVSETGFNTIAEIQGAVTNALAPWLILAMTEVLWLVVTRPIKPRVPRAQRRAAKTPRTRTPRAPRVTSPAESDMPPALFEAERPDMLAALRETAPTA